MFGIKRKKEEVKQPTKKVEKKYIAVPVYINDPEPLLKWNREHSDTLKKFLLTEAGKLLIELYRVNQVKMMISATKSASEKECGQSCGFSMAIDFLEDMAKYNPRSDRQELKEFRIRDSWSASPDVVINNSK